jgi:hypothetical protein
MARWSLLPLVGMGWLARHIGPAVTVALSVVMFILMSTGMIITLKKRRAQAQMECYGGNLAIFAGLDLQRQGKLQLEI